MDRLDAMRILLRVADRGSFSAASRDLGVPLATVSRKVNELEAHLGATSSVLIQLAALILAGPKASACAEAAGYAGVAYGSATALVHPRPRPLPPGMDRDAAMTHARSRLKQAREAARAIPRAALPAFLPASLTGLYLAAAERSPEAPRQPSQFRRQLTMWWRARADRF